MLWVKRYTTLLVIILLLTACGGGGGGGGSEHAQGTGRVYISLGNRVNKASLQGTRTAQATLPSDITSVVVTCTGPGMTEVSGNLPLDGTPLVLLIPAGENRLFTVKAYAGDILRMEGSTVVSYIYPDRETTVIVTLYDVATIEVLPSNTQVQIGTQQQFIANVTAHADTSVTWSVNDIVGGDTTYGTIDSNGLYTAPDTVPTPATVVIKAVSNEDPTLFDTATVTVVETQVPITVTVSPSNVSLGPGQQQNFTAVVTGTANTSVTWSVEDISCGAEAGTIDQTGLYTAGSPVSSCQVTVRATSDEDPTVSGTATVNIVTISVTITPTAARVGVNRTVQFVATVTGTTNTAVTWYVNDIEGGNSTVGTIDSNGLYTAPADVPTPDTVTVKAESQENPLAFDTADVTVFMPTTWVADNSDDDAYFYTATETKDGNYMVAGCAWYYTGAIVKFHKDGKELWEKEIVHYYNGGWHDYCFYDIQVAVDNGYVLAGYAEDDVMIVNIQDDGTLSWKKTYGGGGVEVARSIARTLDYGYIVAGYTNSYGAGGFDGWLLKLNSSGDILWQKTYGGAGDEEFNSVYQTSDGGYVVTGYTTSFGATGKDLWVIRLDSNGSVVWQKRYYADTDYTGSEGTGVIEDSDGNFVVGGNYIDGTGYYSYFWLLKLSSDGTVLWSKRANEDKINSIEETSDGTYILGLGHYHGSYYNSAAIMLVNKNGNQEWKKTYSHPDQSYDDSIWYVTQTSDGGFIATGTTDVDDDGDYQPFILKLFTSGELLKTCSAYRGGAGSSTLPDQAVNASDTSLTINTTNTNDTGVPVSFTDSSLGFGRSCMSGGLCYGGVTFDVNSTDDTSDANPGDKVCADSNGNCTLRAAIEESNFCGGPNTINLPAGNYVLSLGQLNVSDDLKIAGVDANTTIIDGNGNSRVFFAYDPLELSDLTITGANYLYSGGAIVANEDLVIKNSVITNNTAGLCAGIDIGGYGTSYEIVNSVISDNTANSGPGGGICFSTYNQGVTLKIINTTISGNKAINSWVTDGGGLLSREGKIIIQDSVIMNNYTDGFGGGIYGGDLEITNTTISGNTSGSSGGGILVINSLTLQNSTISNNTATEKGGGIYGEFSATNCTISGNTAGISGGGIYSDGYSTTLTNVTITNNSAPSGGGIFYYTSNYSSYKPTLINTIVANQQAGGDCSGAVIDQGGNLDSDGTCGVGVTADPLLGPLQDNGGPTLTHALQALSPAINAGDNTNCPATDQRGVARSDGACDIGAYEYP